VKKGIALFSTLMILVLVIMLMAVALKNSTNIKKSILKDRYIIQENLTVTDVIKLVDNQIASKLQSLSGEQRVEAQNILFAHPLNIQDSVTNSTITVTLKPNDGRLNINFINSDKGEKFIKTILEKIGVKEPEILSEILLANITNLDKYRDDYKIFLKEKDKRAGYINSYNEFKYMLDIYVQNTDDIEVYAIEFEKYFNFYNNTDQKFNRLADNILDINYIELELIDSVVSLKNSIRANIKQKDRVFYSLDELELNSEAMEKETLETNGFGVVTQNIILEINIKSINNRVQYLLNYNLKTKKISNISMDRWIY
jgi:hypothetical protein